MSSFKVFSILTNKNVNLVIGNIDFWSVHLSVWHHKTQNNGMNCEAEGVKQDFDHPLKVYVVIVQLY